MPYDLFFSYRRHDLDRARPLLDALASSGLRVFRDETAIDEGASITQEMRKRSGDQGSRFAGSARRLEKGSLGGIEVRLFQVHSRRRQAVCGSYASRRLDDWLGLFSAEFLSA
jgi:hypothetical protein